MIPLRSHASLELQSYIFLYVYHGQYVMLYYLMVKMGDRDSRLDAQSEKKSTSIIDLTSCLLSKFHATSAVPV